MATVSMIDLDGKEVSIEAERIELVRLCGKPAESWAINAVNKKGGCACPLDTLEALAINGTPVFVRIIEPAASTRGIKRKRRRR